MSLLGDVALVDPRADAAAVGERDDVVGVPPTPVAAPCLVGGGAKASVGGWGGPVSSPRGGGPGSFAGSPPLPAGASPHRPWG